MAEIDHTSQATFVATDPRSKTVFCCANQVPVVAHPDIKYGGVKGQISTFIGKLATSEPLFLLTNPSTEYIKASISAAKYIIEVERNVDDGFQCRYFIQSRDKVIIEEEETPTVQSTTTVPSSSTTTTSSLAKSNKITFDASTTSPSPATVSTSANGKKITVDSVPTTSYSATVVSTPVKNKKMTVDEIFTPSPTTFVKSVRKTEKVIIQTIGKVVPKSLEEDAYVEVHVKDLFGDKNPAAWHINNCFMLLGCKFHQPFAGESILKRVHVMKNTQRGKVWGEGDEPREVTGKWLKGGHGPEWGV